MLHVHIVSTVNDDHYQIKMHTRSGNGAMDYANYQIHQMMDWECGVNHRKGDNMKAQEQNGQVMGSSVRYSPSFIPGGWLGACMATQFIHMDGQNLYMHFM